MSDIETASPILTSKQTLLAAFDDAWSHQWESFESATKGLTEEEALFQHPAYAMEKQDEGWPKPGSVLWHLTHLEYWYHYYLDTLERMPEPAPENPDVEPTQSFDAAMSRLLETRAKLRAKIESLSDDDLAVQLRGMPVAEFVRMVIRHDTWHSSQIRMARRLWEKDGRR
jgi:hypothetical protein